ncbi:DUF6053 domain-containing protein [Lysobacter enzymogenes]|uniref:DUF6053 domain-containing protein n=1 Tax=Lysobacter enzymogenes TaxID=69 RepID=UPI003D18924D
MGGASAPMLFAQIAAIWNKSIGAEAPPTKAVSTGPLTSGRPLPHKTKKKPGTRPGFFVSLRGPRTARATPLSSER